MNKIQRLHSFVEVQASDQLVAGVPTEIEILQAGDWDAPNHGKMDITAQRLDEIVEHFNAGVRKGVPIDVEHKTDNGAVGWVKSLVRAGDSLKANIEWTKHGVQLLADKTFKFISPEFALDGYKDPEGKLDVRGNVLIGAALTNRPLFKNLKPIVASDGGRGNGDSGTKNIIYAEEGDHMQLDDIRKKPVADLTAEEKTFLSEHKAELTDAEQTAYGLKEQVATPPADANGGAAAGGAAGDNTNGNGAATPPIEAAAGTPAAAVAASEKGKEGDLVTISASELDALKKGAELGKMAHATLEHKQASDLVNGLVFNDHKFKPAGENAITEFYLSLDTKQREVFSKDVIGNIQANDTVLGDEKGATDKGALTGAAAMLEAKTQEIMASEKVNYSTALKKASEQNPDLAKQYESELKATNVMAVEE